MIKDKREYLRDVLSRRNKLLSVPCGALISAAALLIFLVVFLSIAAVNYNEARNADLCLANLLVNKSITRDQARDECLLLPQFDRDAITFDVNVIKARIAFFTTMGTMILGINKLFLESPVFFEIFFKQKKQQKKH